MSSSRPTSLDAYSRLVFCGSTNPGNNSRSRWVESRDLPKFGFYKYRNSSLEVRLALAIKKGWMISDIKFESHAPDEDNDVIIITFETRPDAAIHPFVAPQPTKTP